MAYSNSGLRCLIPGVGDGPGIWTYHSTDAHTDVDATDYFTDGDAFGMKVNDIVFVVDTDAVSGTMHVVTVVTTGGAATVSTATLS